MTGEIVLVSVSGHDEPGLMATLTEALTRHPVRVLDIGQAVIHDDLGLGLLIQVSHLQASDVLDNLQAKAREIGVTLRFTAISEARYGEWVSQQGKPRYIVTVFAAGFTGEQLAAVTAVITRHGLNIDGIRRLSGRIPLTGVGESERACIEMRLRGDLDDDRGLKADLMSTASELTFDFSVQADTVYRRNRRLVAFDMDSTLIDVEVIDELARRHGVGPQVAAITERAMRGEIEFRQSFTERVKLLAGLPEEALFDAAQAVVLNDGADRLIRVLKHFGYRTAIISGGFEYVGRHLQRRLGIDYVFANELAVAEGIFTGEVSGEIVDAERKAAILKEVCAGEGISLEHAIAIGDGANDLPMLSVAGLGVAYHAKPLVQESAGHAITNFGLDSVLYLIGFSDRDVLQAEL